MTPDCIHGIIWHSNILNYSKQACLCNWTCWTLRFWLSMWLMGCRWDLCTPQCDWSTNLALCVSEGPEASQGEGGGVQMRNLTAVLTGWRIAVSRRQTEMPGLEWGNVGGWFARWAGWCAPQGAWPGTMEADGVWTIGSAGSPYL